MPINTDTLHAQATEAVVTALAELYENSSPDPDAMRGFAEAMAQIAVSTAEHIMSQAETEISGEGIR